MPFFKAAPPTRRPWRALALPLLGATLLGLTALPVSASAPVGRWADTGSLSKPRDFHTATRLGDGSVLVVGGTTGGPATVKAERFDPGTGTWGPTGSLNTARESHTATLLADGRVLVVGGLTVPPPGMATDVTPTAELYSPSTGVWTPTASLPVAVIGHTATRLADGRVLVAGGSTQVGLGAVSAAEIYDPATGTWTPTGSLQTARWNHSAALLADGRVLVAGGITEGGGVLAGAEVYDPATGQWTPTGATHLKWQGADALRLFDGRVLLLNGSTETADKSPAPEAWNPATGTWTTVAAPQTSRTFSSATLLADGRVLLAAGNLAGAKGLTATAELFDPGTGRWTAAAPVNVIRRMHTATLLADGSVLITGGETTGGARTPSTEIFTPSPSADPPTTTTTTTGPTTTTTLPSAPPEPARPDPAMVTDPGGDVTNPAGVLVTEPRADIIAAWATFGDRESVLRMQTTSFASPLTDANWAGGASFAAWAFDTNGDGEADRLAVLLNAGGTLSGAVAPVDDPGNILCQATSASDADGTLSLVVDTACLGGDSIGAWGAMVVYNQGGSGSDGPFALDFAPDDGRLTTAGVDADGYWLVSKSGVVYPFGHVGSFDGAKADTVDIEPTPTNGGYWILGRDGRVYARGDAPALGDAALPSGVSAVSLSATPSGRGYWVFTDKGGVYAFGDAPFRGDMSGVRLNGPVLGSVATPSGRGYWMVASDGGIFSFGDAGFSGSMGGARLNRPVMSMAPDPDGRGYWLVASDGGIFAFDAPFYGSTGNLKLNKPIAGMVPGTAGYLMVAQDGGIFSFGDVPFHGSLGATPPPSPIVAVALAHHR